MASLVLQPEVGTRPDENTDTHHTAQDGRPMSSGLAKLKKLINNYSELNIQISGLSSKLAQETSCEEIDSASL